MKRQADPYAALCLLMGPSRPFYLRRLPVLKIYNVVFLARPGGNVKAA
jgi:hypothetical protein